jgi:outer membrane lipoprotein-sorting protein
LKRNKFLLPLALLLVFVLLLPLYGCGGGSEGEGQEEEPASSQTASDEEVSLQELFAKGQKVDGYSFDYAMTEEKTGLNMEGKMAIKGSKMRMEMNSPEGQMIQIVDQEVKKAWTYMPEQQMAIEVDMNQVDVPESPSDYAENVEAADAKYLGKEKVNGIDCYKYSVENKEDEGSVIYWVHSEYGLPVRVEITAEDSVTTINYKNFVVGDIEDSQFQLPDGVEVQNISNMMQNLPAAP